MPMIAAAELARPPWEFLETVASSHLAGPANAATVPAATVAGIQSQLIATSCHGPESANSHN